MSLDDFINNYRSVSIVRVYESPEWKKIVVTGSWKGDSAGGCGNYPETFKNNPQFLLNVPRNTPAIIAMSQKDRRGMGARDTFAIGWSIYSLEGKKFNLDYSPKPAYKSGSYNYARDMHVEIPELKGSTTPYTVVCSTFQPGEETDFSWTIITKEEVFITLL
jgi:hypothetical protein